MSKLIEVRVPDLGESKDVAVIEILVKAGDAIEVESPLLTLETDKATMDLPSPLAGEIDSVSVAVGAKVNKGDVIAVVRVAEGAGSAAPSTAAPAPAAAPVPSQSPSPTPAPTPARSPATAPVVSEPLPAASAARADLAEVDHPGFSHAYAGPSVRRLARELGKPLQQEPRSAADLEHPFARAIAANRVDLQVIDEIVIAAGLATTATRVVLLGEFVVVLLRGFVV